MGIKIINLIDSIEFTEKDIVLCDFDGTYVLDNSFHVFLASIWTLGNFRHKFILSMNVIARVLFPFFVTHSAMKKRIILFFKYERSDWKGAVLSKTISKLRFTRSHAVSGVLKKAALRGARVLIVTAAPDFYVKIIADAFNFEFKATDSTITPDWAENVGVAKVVNCHNIIESARGKITVITDSSDDIALSMHADRVIIQASERRFQSIIKILFNKKFLGEVLHINNYVSEEGGGYWLWFDDRPCGPLDKWEVRTILSKHRYALLYVGNGRWKNVAPGDILNAAVLRCECPSVPTSRRRVVAYLRRRFIRDLLGLYH